MLFVLKPQPFHGLIKTSKEPQAHVKILFATKEANKLPVTVLSRCQRFDLRRTATPLLASHSAWVCEQEGVEAEAEAASEQDGNQAQKESGEVNTEGK